MSKGEKTFEKWVSKGKKSFEKWVSEGEKSFEKCRFASILSGDFGFLPDKYEEENVVPVIDLSGLQVPDEV